MTQVLTIPTARILLSIRNRKWTIHDALSELVDNSFGRQRGNARNIHITFNRTKRLVEVLDDGQGCDDIVDLFTLGKGTKESEGDIGRYGVGGSEGLLWLGDKVTVSTLRDGKSQTATVDWAKQIRDEEFPTVNNSWRRADSTNTPTELLELGHGTHIRIKLHRGLRIPNDGEQRGSIRKPLQKLFAPGLLQKRQIIFNGEPLQAYLPDLDQKRSLSFNVTVPQDGGPDLKAYVWIGPAAPGVTISMTDAKAAVMFEYRTIEWTRDCFNGYSGAGIAGTIALSDGWREFLTRNKDGFADENLRDALMERVAEGIQPLLDELAQEQIDTLFTKLALNLNARFGGLFKPDEEGDEEIHVKKGDGPGPGPGPNPREGVEDSENPDDPTRKVSSAMTQIAVKQMTDEDLNGRLVQMVKTSEGLVANVNSEHQMVKDALLKQPINEMLLAALIVTDLARFLLAGDPDDLVRYRVFKRDEWTRLTEDNDAAKGEDFELFPFVLRRLMDGVQRAS
jgi:Histidine kinase-, DNA gyrase B-, and HSP90-like ATPase